MNLPFSHSSFLEPAGCPGTLSRLLGNLSGFAYRRRHDARWTMEFISDGCRDVTGYDPHRFIANASIAFGDLVANNDRERVNERVRLAVLHRHRATVEYLLHTAHGAWLRVEDRLTPVFDAAGRLLAIEGIIDRAGQETVSTGIFPSLAERSPAAPAILPPLQSRSS
ncbi:MAG TPA: PAS domain-containing protein [Lacunisphaera sp.]|nr:PAS domain-containing protein [Lacunisphaera sp.]